MATLKTKLLIRNDFDAAWNPEKGAGVVLSKGEMGVAWLTTPNGGPLIPRVKIGDGKTGWKELPYANENISIEVAEGAGNAIVDAIYTVDDITKKGKLTLKKGYLVKEVSAGKIDEDPITILTSPSENKDVYTISARHAKNIGGAANFYNGVRDGENKLPTTIEVTTKNPTFKTPSFEVDSYGHVNNAGEQTIKVVFPTIPNINILPTTLTGEHPNASEAIVIASLTASGHTITQHAIKMPTKKYVDDKIGVVTNAAMVMRGTLGSKVDGATIQELPEANYNTVGDTYKVVTAGIYNGETSKIGDAFVCYSTDDKTYQWMRIPSGDDIEDTWRSVEVKGTKILGNGTTTGSLKFIDGTLITANNTDAGIAFSHNAIGKKGTLGDGNKASSFIKTIEVDGYGHITSVNTGEVSIDHRPIKIKGADFLASSNTIPLDFYSANENLTIEGDSKTGKLTLTVKDTTYGIVNGKNNGLAPKIANNNSFLVNIGTKEDSKVPTWETIVALDGGSAATTAAEWGTLS